MDPLTVAARFFAFACYLNTDTKEPRTLKAAGTYARSNWKRFLPCVPADLPGFLATGRRAARVHKRVRRQPAAASASRAG
jgi:hypothetical protein